MDEIDGLRVAPRFQRALATAVAEARQRNQRFLGSEHVLLGILSEPTCIAGRVLADLGVAVAVRDRLLTVVALREELLRRRQREQTAMGRMRVGEVADPGVKAELDAAIRDNTGWLGRVIDEYGWPGRSLVGEDGADAAWLMAQHSDHDPAFQRKCLELLEGSTAAGDASKSNVAYLTDRVLLKELGTQIYGTQFNGPDPRPIEDPDNVDKRCADAGLEPLAEYRKHFRGLPTQLARRKKCEGLWALTLRAPEGAGALVPVVSALRGLEDR